MAPADIDIVQEIAQDALRSMRFARDFQLLRETRVIKRLRRNQGKLPCIALANIGNRQGQVAGICRILQLRVHKCAAELKVFIRFLLSLLIKHQ
jgi:hypothetical protein